MYHLAGTPCMTSCAITPYVSYGRNTVHDKLRHYSVCIIWQEHRAWHVAPLLRMYHMTGTPCMTSCAITPYDTERKRETNCSAQVIDPFRNLDPTGIPPMKLWIYDSHMLFLFIRLPELCESTHQVAAQLLVQFRCVCVCVSLSFTKCLIRALHYEWLFRECFKFVVFISSVICL
jgi:hypothetical protein